MAAENSDPDVHGGSNRAEPRYCDIAGYGRTMPSLRLRGFDRQMGGLYIAVFNWMEGPSGVRTGTFAGFAAVGLAMVYLF